MCLANPYSGYKESYSVISLSLVTFARILADAIDRLLASPLIIGICLTSIPGIVSPERIDEINILQATYEAMREAVNKLSVKPDILLNDAVTIPIPYESASSFITSKSSSLFFSLNFLESFT